MKQMYKSPLIFVLPMLKTDICTASTLKEIEGDVKDLMWVD